MAVKIYYDNDCPFCTHYVKFLRLKDTVGPIELVELRRDALARQELEDQGYDLDQGMVVDMDGRRLGGADAVNALAMMSTPSDGFNRFNRMLLASPFSSKLIYPVLRSGRWLTLFFMGREGITATGAGIRSRQAIFSIFFALFSIFHFLTYAFQYSKFPPQLDQFALLSAAILLLFRPNSSRALWLLMAVSTISAFVQAPVASNHTMVRNGALVGYWASFLYAMIRGRNWGDIFKNFTVSGQGVLLVMYFYGIFHKLNTSFLNPETSCAVALWRLMPAPLKWLDHPIFLYATIYGTFIVEGALIISLLIPKLRHKAVVGGILFHLLLAMSNYSFYIAFTVLSISLHTLFISGPAAERILASDMMKSVSRRLRNPIYLLAGVIITVLTVIAIPLGYYSFTTLLLLPIVLPFCYLVVRYGSSAEPLLRSGQRCAAFVIGSVVTAVFFVNGMMPYLGLKSAQSINMFANLRLEGGVSNHLIMKNPPGPFTYLEDVAVIIDAGADEELQWYQDNDYAMVYYDLLDRLEYNPALSVTVELNGETLTDISAKDVQSDIDEILHPRWFRKYFHFQPARLDLPERCNN